jgi:amino acid transporter
VHSGDPNSAAFDIAAAIGGRLMSSVFLAGLVITQLASGIAAQASASRLLFAMGRDNVLPRRVFGYLQRKFHTPVINIVLIGLVGLAAVKLDTTTSVSFINFGAFTAFTFVNLCVIAMAIRRHALRGPLAVLVNLVVPLIGAGIDVWLLTNLDANAIRLGLSWLAVGIVYLTYLTRGFRRPPPEMDFAEEEPELASA